jgi:hypothetical protein
MTGAPITIEDSGRLEPGDTGVARLHPLYWEAWEGVEPGALLTMLEGAHVVGGASVLEVARR